MFHFYWPWFALLLPLPYIVKLLLPAKKVEHEDAPVLHFPAVDRVKQAFTLSKASSKKSGKTYYALLSLSWILLVTALMQPEIVDQFKQVTNKGYDLMLAVDISGSMQALDFSTQTKKISRLDVTKEVVSEFVMDRQGDRVGLVTFGENAYLHVPLTLDTFSVSRMLNDIVSGMAGNATAIGDAIGLSVRTLRERPEGSRVLILLTDGDDNSSNIPPMEAAKLAKQYGIKIYTIGIGKNGKVPFPMSYGGYGMVEVKFNEELLKEIASMTGGRYFAATNQKALESIYNKISELEKSESNQTIFLIRDPLYYYPLGLAIIILFMLVVYRPLMGYVFSQKN